MAHDGLDEDGNELGAQFDKSAPAMQAVVKKILPASNAKIVINKNAVSQIQRSAAKPASQAGSGSQSSDDQGSTTSKGSSSTASSASVDLADYHGKIIVSYDATAKSYQVWMAGHSLTAPVLKSA